MERLSGLDAAFLYIETPTVHMHVCATIVMDPSTVQGGYSLDTVKDLIRERLHLVPPLRRRLATVPFNLHHPVWVEDPDFDLDYHVRRIGCPAPGGEAELAELVGDIASRQLDRSRPLWELWVVENLAGGKVAAVAKMHHCTVDGVSGANMLVHFLDIEADPAPQTGVEDGWKPERTPSDVELLGRAIVTRVSRPLQLARVLPQTLRAATSFVLARRRRDGAGMPAPLRSPRTAFNGVITPHRKVAFARIPLERVKAVKNAFGTTVNDVVLAVCSGALRRYLDRNEDLPGRSLTAVVPVSVRTEEQQKQLGTNRVSALFTSLSTDVDDPVERLMAIHEVNKGAKEEHHAIGAHMLRDWAEFAAPTTFSLAARAYSSLGLAERVPTPYNLVISNVPGPPIPLYFAGAKLEALYPLGPIMHGLGLNVTVLSYRDTLYWGLIACRELMPDLWDLAAAIPEALAELAEAAPSVKAGA
jgi:diacylglycerol O-acyltransferase